MLIQACLNGARSKDYHPNLPIDPGTLAADAAAAVAAGAGELHLHVRGPDGSESLAPEHVGATLVQVRSRLPGTLIGISTGAWIEPDDDRRLALIGSWGELPDHASVNLSEDAAPAVIERLHRRGIGIEAGIASVADAQRLAQLGLAPLALRLLIEIGEQELGEALAVVQGIVDVLAQHHVRKPALLHGFDATVWPLIDEAFRRGFSTRVGLEDGCLLPDGQVAVGNAALVAAAVARRR